MPAELADYSHLLASVPVVAVVLLFAWRMSRQQQTVTDRQNELIDRWWNRHEEAEEKQRQTIESLATNVAANTVALVELSKNIRLQTPSLDSLSHEIRTMGHHDHDPLHIGVPDGRFDPDQTYSASKLQAAGDIAPWTHARYGIPGLHRAGVTGKGAVVVVVDTGVDTTHPDLLKTLDLPNSRSFTGEPLVDLNGHGTHVGGTIAAVDNDLGTLGIAPDAKVIHCKGLNNRGSGGGASLANAIRYATDLPGHKIFSLSFGSAGEDPQISAAIRYAVAKGHWVVAAAGNSGPGSINWPGALEEVICVGALDDQDRVANFSSANDLVDVGFGGVDILSTIPGNRYAKYSGTSMATPGVAGVLALAVGELVKAGKPIPDQKAMTAALYATCKDVGVPGRDPGAGWGLVQPAEFIRKLVGAAPLPTPPKPSEPVRIAVPEGAKFVVVQFV